MPPVALEPSTVVVVLPEHFAQLKAALPHFVAAAGSPTLMALSSMMVNTKNAASKAKAAATYQGRHAKPDKPDRSIAVIARWERLTLMLLPFRGEGGASKTLSFRIEDYPPPERMPRERGRVGMGGDRPPTAAERREAKLEAQSWRTLNRDLKRR